MVDAKKLARSTAAAGLANPVIGCRESNQRYGAKRMTDTHNYIIDELIRSFDEKCKSEGHHFAPSSIFPSTEYCQACGATRARISVALKERE